MKYILTIALLSVLTLTNIQAKDADIEACKTYINEAKKFQDTMKTNIVSEATMAFYKDQVVANCGTLGSKAPYKTEFFANEFMKKDKASLASCVLAVKMAKTYQESGDVSPFILNAHKVNISDNCGSLAAKKRPANCLFDVVDNTSKEALKKRCLASIEKAYDAMGTEAASASKAEVVANCGRLHKTI